MKKKLLIALAIVLVVAMSVTGTLAYLTANTGAVTNTFTVGKVFDEEDSDTHKNFELLEHGITGKPGEYTLDLQSEVSGNEYTVMPGVNIPKDPFVRVNRPVGVDVYLFVEVVDGTSEQLTVTVDPAKWTKLAGVTGTHGGDVYTLASGKLTEGNTLEATYILANNEIAVANATIVNPGKVTFYGYLIQAAGFTSAEDAAVTGFSFTKA